MIETVPMGLEHIAQMADIEKLCFKTPWSYDMLSRELSNPLATYYIVQYGYNVVAYMGFYTIVDEAHVTNIAVRPSYQGKHIASGLLEYTLQKMRDAGIKRATLEVNEHNERAIALYEKYGFVAAGKRPNYYEGVDAAVIYWLEL